MKGNPGRKARRANRRMTMPGSRHDRLPHRHSCTERVTQRALGKPWRGREIVKEVNHAAQKT